MLEVEKEDSSVTSYTATSGACARKFGSGASGCPGANFCSLRKCTGKEDKGEGEKTSLVFLITFMGPMK